MDILLFQNHLLKVVFFFHIFLPTIVKKNYFLLMSVFILNSVSCSTDLCAYHDTNNMLYWLL